MTNVLIDFFRNGSNYLTFSRPPLPLWLLTAIRFANGRKIWLNRREI